MVSSDYTEQFRSVKIIHDNIHRIDFSYLAEFFRFIGIFVCENIVVESQDETEVEKNTKYSACIFVGKRKLTEDEVLLLGKGWQDDKRGNVVSVYEKCLSGLKDGTIFLYDEVMNELAEDKQNPVFSTEMLFRLEKDGQKNVLNRLIEVVAEKIYGDSAVFQEKQFEDLIEVFVDDELWFHSLNLQYYAKWKSVAAVNAKDAFLSAHDKTEGIIKKRREKYGEAYDAQCFYKYAFLWCRVKVNTACDCCREILYFPINELAGQCRELYRKYPGFSNAKILEGLCYAPSSNSANEAVWAFNNALQEIKKECFASPVYYWIGKRYEPYKDHREDAKKAFVYANKCKRKFRNYFKIAVFARNEEKYSEAIKQFEEILHRLDMKKRMCYVDPLEVEYLFKTYTQLAYIYYKQNDYANAIRMGKYVIGVMDTFITLENSGNNDLDDFFKAFYYKNEGAEQYREILKNRLDISTTYTILSESYARMSNPVEAKKYWNKSLK